MTTRTAILILLAYFAAVVILALTVGPEPMVLGIPLNTFLLSLGLLLTPLPTWFLTASSPKEYV